MKMQSEKTENKDVAYGATIVLDHHQGNSEAVYGDGSFKQKCLNFYRQGKFMEDYEDDVPWNGVFERYFPTYHDLSIPKLRGYFTWRTNVRKGIYRPIATSLAYIYIYELLNGIGTTSAEESLWKMQEFETEYLDTGVGDCMMSYNLHRWMLEFAVIHQLPKKLALTFANPKMLERDRKIAILRDPEKHSDEEVFNALCHFNTGKLESSPVITKNPDEGRRLFAEVWQHTITNYNDNGEDFITACFGPWKAFPWYPLANSVYHETRELTDFDYALDECRIYQYRDGRWLVQTYEELLFNKKRINSLLHETDRLLRIYLKTGHPLRPKPENAWATPTGRQKSKPPDRKSTSTSTVSAKSGKMPLSPARVCSPKRTAQKPPSNQRPWKSWSQNLLRTKSRASRWIRSTVRFCSHCWMAVPQTS